MDHLLQNKRYTRPTVEDHGAVTELTANRGRGLGTAGELCKVNSSFVKCSSTGAQSGFTAMLNGSRGRGR